MRHRIFIAINFPDEMKKKLGSYQERIEELFTPYRNEVSGSGPVRWTKTENLHITLAFLGYLSDEELFNVCKITKEITQRHQPFSITLNKILYGPPKKMPPRMVWVEGEKSKDLANLQLDLEKSLLSSGKIKFEPEERSFTCHITLGRIKTWEFRQIEPEERPNVEQDISLSFEVNSIEVMESQLKRTGPEYSVLESAPLKT